MNTQAYIYTHKHMNTYKDTNKHKNMHVYTLMKETWINAKISKQ